MPLVLKIGFLRSDIILLFGWIAMYIPFSITGQVIPISHTINNSATDIFGHPLVFPSNFFL